PPPPDRPGRKLVAEGEPRADLRRPGPRRSPGPGPRRPRRRGRPGRRPRDPAPLGQAHQPGRSRPALTPGQRGRMVDDPVLSDPPLVAVYDDVCYSTAMSIAISV